MVGRIERQHALGQPGDQLTAPLALRARGARQAGRGQAGRAQGQELPSAYRVANKIDAAEVLRMGALLLWAWV